VYPIVLIGTLRLWQANDLPAYAFFVSLLVGFAWPGCFLLSRRLREPLDLDVVEADARPHVLVLHPAPAPGNALLRLCPTPAFFQDWADAQLHKALRASLSAVGPLLRMQRPLPPPSHGPVGRPEAEIERRERRLVDRARGAALVVMIVDGTEANLREIELIGGEVDLRRIMLVLPPRLDPAFFERWQALRGRLPGLPELEPTMAAVRFSANATPRLISASWASFVSRRVVLSKTSRMVSPSELRPEPKPPMASWALSMLPIGAGLASAVVTPTFLDEHDLHLRGDGTGVFGLICMGVGILLAFMSRRSMRLVPSNELPMVLMAASPWWFVEGVSLLESHSVEMDLRVTGQAAAYAAPMLLTTAFVLAGASMIRKSVGRRLGFIVIGCAAVIPSMALAASLSELHVDVGGLFLATLAAGFVIGVAVVAASGDGLRRHAPLSIGAPVCAALSVAAWGTAVTHGAWRDALRTSQTVDISALLVFDAYAAWFLLALPLYVVWVGTTFSRRATSTAASNALSLLPLALLLAVVAARHQDAHRTWIEERPPQGRAIYAGAVGVLEVPGFTPSALRLTNPAQGSADIVLDRGGALAHGRRVSSAVELSSFGATGGPALSRVVSNVLTQPGRDWLRVLPSPDADASTVLTLCRVAWTYRRGSVQLLGQDPGDDRGVFVAVQPYEPRRAADEVGNIVLLNGQGAIVDPISRRIQIPRGPRGELSERDLENSMHETRTFYPEQRTVVFFIEGGASAQDLMTALAAAQRAGFDELQLANRNM